MKKEYQKPTTRFHKLRCRSMVTQSPNEAKIQVKKSDEYSDTEWGD